jgi:hypothetical protein
MCLVNSVLQLTYGVFNTTSSSSRKITFETRTLVRIMTSARDLMMWNNPRAPWSCRPSALQVDGHILIHWWIYPTWFCLTQSSPMGPRCPSPDGVVMFQIAVYRGLATRLFQVLSKSRLFCSWLISSSDSNGSTVHSQSHQYHKRAFINCVRHHMSTPLGFPETFRTLMRPSDCLPLIQTSSTFTSSLSNIRLR